MEHCRLKKRSSRLVIGLCVAAALVGGSVRPAAALPHDLVPRASWTYDALAKFAAKGQLPGISARSLHGDELRTRVELARLVMRLVEAAGGNGTAWDEAERALARRLIGEFEPEYRYLEVDAAALRERVGAENDAARRWRWSATGYVMGRVLERRDGDEGSDLIYRATGIGTFGRYLLATGTVTNEQEIWSDRPQAFNHLDRLFAQLETKFATWKLGEDNRYWGPGYGGAMMLSDNPPGFLSLEGQKRFKVPLFGRILFTQFAGTFEEVGGRKYVVARRVERMVGRRFGFALAEAYKSNTGKQLPLALVLPLYVYGSQVLDKSVRRSESLNYLANIQLTYLPSEDVTTYLDFILDDVTGFIGKSETVPRKIGFLFGVHLPRALGSDRTDVRVEYALTDGDDPDRTLFEGGTYLHRNPEIAWFHSGLVMGHRMANNRRGPFVRVRHQVSPKLVGIFEWEDEDQFRPTPMVGDRRRLTLYGAYDLAPDKSVALRIDRLRGALGADTVWQLQAAYSF